MRSIEARKKAAGLLASYSNEMTAKQEHSKRVLVAERQMAHEMNLQEGQKLHKKEMDRRSMRRQWRKELDNGYAVDMFEHKLRKTNELFEQRKKGSVSLERLGTHYKVQMENQKIADNKMRAHAQGIIGTLA